MSKYKNNTTPPSRIPRSKATPETYGLSTEAFITELKLQAEVEMVCKNEAYAFILQNGLFFELRKFHDENRGMDHFSESMPMMNQLAESRHKN
jgi:hypothetical protein